MEEEVCLQHGIRISKYVFTYIYTYIDASLYMSMCVHKNVDKIRVYVCVCVRVWTYKCVCVRVLYLWLPSASGPPAHPLVMLLPD
jgi:hypothetical protein